MLGLWNEEFSLNCRYYASNDLWEIWKSRIVSDFVDFLRSDIAQMKKTKKSDGDWFISKFTRQLERPEPDEAYGFKWKTELYGIFESSLKLLAQESAEDVLLITNAYEKAFSQ